MKPSNFKQSNLLLTKPKGMTDEECGNLPVYKSENGLIISLWKTSFWSRLKFLFHGNLWLGVHGGSTQPPVWLDLTKTVFKK